MACTLGGRECRASGWGPAFLDPGSGYDLGAPCNSVESWLAAGTWPPSQSQVSAGLTPCSQHPQCSASTAAQLERGGRKLTQLCLCRAARPGSSRQERRRQGPCHAAPAGAVQALRRDAGAAAHTVRSSCVHGSQITQQSSACAAAAYPPTGCGALAVLAASSRCCMC